MQGLEVICSVAVFRSTSSKQERDRKGKKKTQKTNKEKATINEIDWCR